MGDFLSPKHTNILYTKFEGLHVDSEASQNSPCTVFGQFVVLLLHHFIECPNNWEFTSVSSAYTSNKPQYITDIETNFGLRRMYYVMYGVLSFCSLQI
jgi:hypothetical protein